MTTAILDPDQIKALIQNRGAAEVVAADTKSAATYRYIKPLSQAAEGLIDFAANPDGRFMLGLHDIDVMTRGFAPGELIYVSGRSHSGKTQVLLNALKNNADKVVVMFTPDETAELVLSKLVSLSRGVNAEDVEARIKAGDEPTKQMVRKVATHDFANLIVIDESLGLAQMSAALDEVRSYTGKEVSAAIVDYLEILDGGEADGGIQALSKSIKRWAKDQPFPTMVLRQNSRSSGKRGQGAGMSGMTYGGENEAIVVLEVFRKKEDPDLDEWEALRHENTVTVALVKNKRPPSKTGTVDFFIDPNVGTVRPLRDGDVCYPKAPMTSAADAMAAQREAGTTAVQVQDYDEPLPFVTNDGLEEDDLMHGSF